MILIQLFKRLKLYIQFVQMKNKMFISCIILFILFFNDLNCWFIIFLKYTAIEKLLS